MERLDKNWITENRIDFEYKKYILLAYLQHVSECFRSVRLYPALADLVDHYRLVVQLKENKQDLFDRFPQRLTGVDAGTFRLQYEAVMNDERIMSEIESILDFSLPRFAEWVNEGKHIYDFLEKEIALLPVGIIPIDTSSGYLFLKGGSAETRVYGYTTTLFENAESTWRGIHTEYIRTYSHSIVRTFESMKTELVRENRTLPNPAVYVAETGLDIPLKETFLPIAKRKLIVEVNNPASA